MKLSSDDPEKIKKFNEIQNLEKLLPDLAEMEHRPLSGQNEDLIPVSREILADIMENEENMRRLDPFHDDEAVTNLAVYKIQKSLRTEGFELVTDNKGKLTLVIRINSR